MEYTILILLLPLLSFLFLGLAGMKLKPVVAGAIGTAVLAVREGVATAARRSDSYGVCLQLLHPDGTETLYAHLQYLYVRTGETVQAGQILGTAGQTGRATGAHLHFELRRQGTACDPSALLGLSDV